MGGSGLKVGDGRAVGGTDVGVIKVAVAVGGGVSVGAGVSVGVSVGGM